MLARRDEIEGTVPMCHHTPACPSADAVDRDAARTAVRHPEQGWSLLCNGVVSFDDHGDLLPNGHAVAPAVPTPRSGRSLALAA